MVGPAAKREGVAHLQAALGLSERRACSIVSADRKMILYRSCRPPDTDLREHLRELAVPCGNPRHLSGRRVARELTVLIDQRGKPGIDRLGQWHRIHVERHARLGAGEWHYLALHRAGQTHADRLL
jgi:hypothetical protein